MVAKRLSLMQLLTPQNLIGLPQSLLGSAKRLPFPNNPSAWQLKVEDIDKGACRISLETFFIIYAPGGDLGIP